MPPGPESEAHADQSDDTDRRRPPQPLHAGVSTRWHVPVHLFAAVGVPGPDGYQDTSARVRPAGVNWSEEQDN